MAATSPIRIFPLCAPSTHAYAAFPATPRYPHPLTRLCVWRLFPARLLIDPGLPARLHTYTRYADTRLYTFHTGGCARTRWGGWRGGLGGCLLLPKNIIKKQAA